MLINYVWRINPLQSRSLCTYQTQPQLGVDGGHVYNPDNKEDTTVCLQKCSRYSDVSTEGT